eukprot:CAMPEP_0177591758 /NCGR_PEP_ID=MMETSP0419_2-20121207/8177_1 /TAXON_ID=582737 /ORGANISM="Tetraselmis sp., Strain GSL018" /LENGTH=268 /DNA_ID=CAMNT_0019082539 /DNA_START=1173 /DNA_END=1976 /DNA_ORIENTATION=+
MTGCSPPAVPQVDGPPSFLDPEATRPLAVNEAHTRRPAAVAAAELASTGGGADEPVPGPRSEFDVSSLAPRLSKKSGGQAERKVGVIQAKARMYSQEGQQGPQYSAAAIAMLGGNIDGHSEGEESTKRKQPSSAMGVDEFLSKSTGAQLPRKQQDRKEREKKKRQLGQSSIGSWKTEAEMVLRQQYDEARHGEDCRWGGPDRKAGPCLGSTLTRTGQERIRRTMPPHSTSAKDKLRLLATACDDLLLPDIGASSNQMCMLAQQRIKYV